ncbi:hypothetical protein D3C81_1862430 [compost metagenome]
MHQHENQAVLPQAEPQQRQWQQGNCRQWIEHGGQGAQQVAAELGRDRQGGQAERQDDADQVALEQHHQGNPHLAQQLTAEQAVIQRMSGLHKTRQQQVVVRVTRSGLPEYGKQNQDQAFAQPALLPQALAER